MKPVNTFSKKQISIKRPDQEAHARLMLRANNLPEWQEQILPVPGRRFRSDFAWPEQKVILEVNGGTWGRGPSGHSSGAGIKRDYEKMNLLQLNGWLVIQISSDMIETTMCSLVKSALELRGK